MSALRAIWRLAGRVFDRIEDALSDPLAQRALEADLGLPPCGLERAKTDQPPLTGIHEYISAVDPTAEQLRVAFDAVTAYVRFWQTVFEAARTEDPSIVVDEALYRLFEVTTVDLIKFEHPAVYAWMRLLGVVHQDVILTLEETFVPDVPANLFTTEYYEAWFRRLEQGYLRFRLEQQDDIVREPDDSLPPPQRTRQRQLDVDMYWRSDVILLLGVEIVVAPLLKMTGAAVEHFYGWELPPRPRQLPCAPPQPLPAVPLAEHIASRGSTIRISAPSATGPRATATLTQFFLIGADGRLGWHFALRGEMVLTGMVGPAARRLTATLRIDAPSGFDAVLRFSGNDKFSVAGTADAGLHFKLEPAQSSAQGPAFSIPQSTGSRLEIGEFLVSADVSTDGLSVKASARKSAIVIEPADADSFVDEALRSKKTRVEFDLGVTIDDKNGFSFDGGARLATTIAVNKSVGPVTVRSVQLSLTPDGSDTGSEVSLAALASLRFGLGLLTIDIEQIGLTLDVGSTSGQLPDGALPVLSSLLYLGNLGFRPPSGIGVAVDSGPVTGGGFLFHDSENGQYAGVLQLEILERASLKAVGLLTTRLPDGGKGFSFLIIASVEFDPPLGPFLGVTVRGLGIIVGVHRTIDTDALREGLRNRALDAILFPPDPVADAARVVKAVGTVFPPARDRHLVGIAAKLGFGNPPIATLELAIVWERGGSPKWVVMGQLHAALPRGAPVKILELHVDGAGIWDLDRGEFSLDARMYDSRLAFATFGGDVALRTRKSGEDSFVLFSAGGYHPEFAAPVGFPKLDRIRFALADSKHFRLVLTGYMAFTPNTKQFGAEVKLFLGAAGFSFECELGFDALFDDDLGFVIDFDLEIKIKYKGRTLLGADIWGRFTGPEPKHIKGEWSVDLFLFSVGKSFDRTFGNERPPAELPRLDPLPPLVAALRDKHNWTAAAPPGRALVSLRTRPDEPAIAVHPLGGLAVRQTVLPLGVTIDRFASATVPGGRRFDLTGVRIGGQPVDGAGPVDELFAAAEFLTLTDDEKLARPSFEAMQAGLALQPDGVTFGGQDAATESHRTVSDVDFEDVVFGADGGEVRDPVQGTVSATTAILAAEFGAAARSALRVTGRNRYQAPVVGPRLLRSTYVVAGIDELAAVAIPGAERAQSFTATRQALDRHPDARSLQVVAAFQTEAFR